uniref:Putative RxLR effector n=1 Tax=Plasmopara viticola TaxID=143451 RepID=A0A650F562_PLAVT|nr:putative RxLR effector [Plasmopara viticola]
MRGTNYVAIALLLAAGSQTAAEFVQDDLQQTSDDHLVASFDLLNEMLQSRFLRASRDPKDDLLSVGDEERTPLSPNSFLKELKVSNSIMDAANVVRSEGEATALETASKTLNQLKSNKRQRIAQSFENVAGEAVRTLPDSDKSMVSVANGTPLVWAKRRRTKRPRAMMTNAARSAKQHDYRPAPTESSTYSAKASDGQLSKQLITQKASDTDKSLVSVANEKPFVLAKRRRTKRSAAMMTNAARSAKQHDYRLAPTESSTIPAKAPHGQLNKQPISQKALQLDKNEHVDESLWREQLMTVDEVLHLFEEFDKPAAVNHQEANAIETAPENLNHLRRNNRKHIASTTNNVVGQVSHASPYPDKSPVLVAKNIPFVLAKRLKLNQPTAIMENAARFVTQHDYRLAPSDPSTINAEFSNSRLKYHLISQKALHLDKNEFANNVKRLQKQEPNAVEHLSHLREKNDRTTLHTPINYRSVPIDWKAEIANGPKLLRKDRSYKKVKKIHEAFLEAFNLPFHQYPQETAMMLRLVRRRKKSSPNNVEIYKDFMYMAELQQQLSHLQKVLDPDLKKLLGSDTTMLPINLENLQEAFNVKLVIMYELFFEFCHDRKDLVEGLPRKPKRNRWILRLSTSNSGNKNHQVSLPD